MDFQNKDTIVTHVETPIESHHFTPFASLLWHLPTAIKDVYGDFNTAFFWVYEPSTKTVRVAVDYVVPGRRYVDARVRSVTDFDHTEYSFAQIRDKLDEKRIKS